MIRLLARLVLTLLGNAIGLIVAAVLLDKMEIDGLSFVVAVAIFTVVEVVAEPLLRQIAVRNVPALMGSIALVTTFVGLLITDLLTDGLQIEGVGTWILATIVVWAVGLAASIVLPLFLFKQVLDDRPERRA